ncbi:MAG: hypothetical protein LH654_04780 [Thermoleophilia bacterium]|nr:hypothetical protein [Thermoleophilia bacterium]
MEGQSHKGEMRAALRGDFERMCQRQAGESEPAEPAAPQAMTHIGPAPAVDAPSGSWLDRILRRT